MRSTIGFCATLTCLVAGFWFAPAADAQEIDTTDLRVEDVVGRIESLVRERSPAWIQASLPPSCWDLGRFWRWRREL